MPPPRLFHFSEDPSIESFDPHVAATSATNEAYVWVIDAEHEQFYWFPRDCPRVSFWPSSNSSAEAVEWCERQTRAPRVHAVETAWYERIRDAKLFVYVFDAATFTRKDAAAGHWVSREPVVPLDVVPAGNLLDKHLHASDELRFTPSLRPLEAFLPTSTLGFSMTRLRNAQR